MKTPAKIGNRDQQKFALRSVITLLRMSSKFDIDDILSQVNKAKQEEEVIDSGMISQSLTNNDNTAKPNSNADGKRKIGNITPNIGASSSAASIVPQPIAIPTINRPQFLITKDSSISIKDIQEMKMEIISVGRCSPQAIRSHPK